MYTCVCGRKEVQTVPQSPTLFQLGRGPAQMKSIFLSRTPTDSTTPTRWPTHACTHRICRVKTLKLSYSICVNIDRCTHLYQDITFYSHKGTEHSWLKRMFHFSSSQHSQIDYACLCVQSPLRHASLCVCLPRRLWHLCVPMQDIRLTMLCETLWHISTQKIQWHEAEWRTKMQGPFLFMSPLAHWRIKQHLLLRAGVLS